MPPLIGKLLFLERWSINPVLMIESMAMDLYGSELEIEDQLWQSLLYQVLTNVVIKTLNTKLQQLPNSVTGLD